MADTGDLDENIYSNARPVDVHTWSDYPEVNDFVDQVFEIRLDPFQEDSFKRHVISKYNQMLYINSWLLYNFFVQFDPPVQLIRPVPVPS